MRQSIGAITLLVREYDEAIDYFTGPLGFDLIEDARLSPDKRWVRVMPKGGVGTALLLARAATADQEAQIGNQAGGRVLLFLKTDDFWRDYEAMRARGVAFQELPRDEPYGTVAVFQDLYGNRWDLLQLR